MMNIPVDSEIEARDLISARMSKLNGVVLGISSPFERHVYTLNMMKTRYGSSPNTRTESRANPVSHDLRYALVSLGKFRSLTGTALHYPRQAKSTDSANTLGLSIT